MSKTGMGYGGHKGGQAAPAEGLAQQMGAGWPALPWEGLS